MISLKLSNEETRNVRQHVAGFKVAFQQTSDWLEPFGGQNVIVTTPVRSAGYSDFVRGQEMDQGVERKGYESTAPTLPGRSTRFSENFPPFTAESENRDDRVSKARQGLRYLGPGG